jgi:hypothetical protein
LKIQTQYITFVRLTQRRLRPAQQTLMVTAANGGCEPILLKNSLLRLQIFKKQKTVLHEAKYAKKHR